MEWVKRPKPQKNKTKKNNIPSEIKIKHEFEEIFNCYKTWLHTKNSNPHPPLLSKEWFEDGQAIAPY